MNLLISKAKELKIPLFFSDEFGYGLNNLWKLIRKETKSNLFVIPP